MTENHPTLDEFKTYMLTQYPELMKPYVNGYVGAQQNLLVDWVDFHKDMIKKYNVLKYIGAENEPETDGYAWCSMNTLVTWIWFHPEQFELVLI